MIVFFSFPSLFWCPAAIQVESGAALHQPFRRLPPQVFKLYWKKNAFSDYCKLLIHTVSPFLMSQEQVFNLTHFKLPSRNFFPSAASLKKNSAIFPNPPKFASYASLPPHLFCTKKNPPNWPDFANKSWEEHHSSETGGGNDPIKLFLEEIPLWLSWQWDGGGSDNGGLWWGWRGSKPAGILGLATYLSAVPGGSDHRRRWVKVTGSIHSRLSSGLVGPPALCSAAAEWAEPLARHRTWSATTTAPVCLSASYQCLRRNENLRRAAKHASFLCPNLALASQSQSCPYGSVAVFSKSFESMKWLWKHKHIFNIKPAGLRINLP